MDILDDSILDMRNHVDHPRLLDHLPQDLFRDVVISKQPSVNIKVLASPIARTLHLFTIHFIGKQRRVV